MSPDSRSKVQPQHLKRNAYVYIRQSFTTSGLGALTLTRFDPGVLTGMDPPLV
jgi:hypothetical protein